MTREFDNSRPCAQEQHSGLNWDRVNSEEQYRRTNYNYGPQISAALSFDVGGARISLGTGGYGDYGGRGGYPDYSNYGGRGSYDDYSGNSGYSHRREHRPYAPGNSNNYGNDIYETNASRVSTQYNLDRQRFVQEQYNQQRYQDSYQQNDYRYQQPSYNQNYDDRYVLNVDRNRDLYSNDQYYGSNDQYFPSPNRNGYQNDSYSSYSRPYDRNDRYVVDYGYSNQDDYYRSQPGRNNNSRYYDDYSYQSNRYDQYNQDRYSQNRYYQDRYSQDQYQAYRYPNGQNDQYNQYDRYGQQDRYGRNGYQNDYGGDDWSRMRITLQNMLGHTANEYNRSVPNDLGCATIVSAALRQAHGVRIHDTNVNGLENSLRQNGYRAMPVQYAQPGDCIIAHRAGGRPGHAAIYVGDGKIVNNSSAQGRVIVAPLNNFASRDYQSVVAYRRA